MCLLDLGILLRMKGPRLQPGQAKLVKKASHFQAQFQRLRHRRGPKKAICAVAAASLTAAYHMLRDGTFYHDLGTDHFDGASPEDQANKLALWRGNQDQNPAASSKNVTKDRAVVAQHGPKDRQVGLHLHSHAIHSLWGFCFEDHQLWFFA
jgi:hypothetical protein